MRCKPGDLAYIARDDFPENIGRVVEILRPATLDGTEAPGFWWEVRAIGAPMPTLYHGEAVFAGYVHEMESLDADLRLISGVPVEDEVCSEVTA
jgi:hypothetical protein